MDKLNNFEPNINFDALIKMIKIFSGIEQSEEKWLEFELELKNMGKKNETNNYTYKRISYFCKKINDILEEKPELKIKYSDLLVQRNLINLKLQFALCPTLIDKLRVFIDSNNIGSSISFKEAKTWELKNRLSRELSYFLEKNFPVNAVNITFLEKIKDEVQDYINNNKILYPEKLKKDNKIFKISPDGKIGYFYKGTLLEKWQIINNEFLNINLSYKEVSLHIQMEESLYKQNRLRFYNLNKILYPDTRDITIIISIKDVISELRDLSQFTREKSKTNKFQFPKNNINPNTSIEKEFSIL